jgi:UDP-N-acetylglucosamine/UDP-N-acetylgalactosamine diphosphorylase
MRDVPPDLLHRLRLHHQEHVLLGWETLSASQRQALIDQLSGIDLEEIDSLYARRDEGQTLASNERIEPAPMIPHDSIENQARQVGSEALARGEVAVLLVAGGQGSRLGFDKPKGMFPIGPISNKSLFQIHAEKVFALQRRFGRTVPFLIMTSPATHDDTVAYFREQHWFGLSEWEVLFFQQGTMPAVDIASGRLLLEKPGLLFTSPNGHGGTITALSDSGLLNDLRRRGIRSLFYFQVDNPLVKIADPGFVGQHLLRQSETSSKAIEKAYPEEKMGVLSLIDGRCGIIEYTDMPNELLHAKDAEDRLLHRAGSPAIHIFDVEFLQRITEDASKLPYHIARKKVPCIDNADPRQENALKFERFIFDALPLAERWLVQEALRAEEFSPVKNKEGADSPETARRDLINLAARWLELAGIKVPRDEQGDAIVPIEISPRFALDHEELIARIELRRMVDAPLYLE